MSLLPSEPSSNHESLLMLRNTHTATVKSLKAIANFETEYWPDSPQKTLRLHGLYAIEELNRCCLRRHLNLDLPIFLPEFTTTIDERPPQAEDETRANYRKSAGWVRIFKIGIRQECCCDQPPKRTRIAAKID